MRADGRVALLDWDDAGPIVASSELLGTALSFAGGSVEPDAACVRACVQAYLDIGDRGSLPTC